MGYSSTRKLKRKQEEEGPELPFDVLGIIAKKLAGVNDLISFGQVCKSWRRVYFDSWRNFMASQAPLILQKTPHAKRSCSLYSIFDERSYNIWLPSFSGFSFVGFSSGYLITMNLLTLMLINPFTRRTITIPKPDDMSRVIDRAMLAFKFGSNKEFILVILFSRSFHMHVYMSENSKWYLLLSRDGTPLKIMDMALKSTNLFAITDKAEVGIAVRMDKNSQSSVFLDVLYPKPPFGINSRNLKLVISPKNDELLVVDFKPFQHLAIYKIELLKEYWTRLETLRDCALFLGAKTKCSSLSNPSEWGLEKNCVYYIDHTSACKVISMDNQVIRTILLPERQFPLTVKLCNIDWCFRHQCEVGPRFML